MERWVTKVIALFLIFIGMTSSGLLPIKVSKWFSTKGEKGLHYLSVLSCFGGGVFFGTYLMHMAPDVRAILEESLLKPYKIEFPIPELITAAGFFLLLFIDKLVMFFSKIDNNDGEVETKVAEAGEVIDITLYDVKHTHEHHFEPPSSPRIIAKGIHHYHNPATTSPRLIIKNMHNHNAEEHEKNNHDTVSAENLKNVEVSTNHLNGTLKSNDVKYMNGENLCKTICNSVQQPNHKVTVEPPVEKDVEIDEADASLAAKPYIFLVALSIDCIFEGMSLGLQATSWGAWTLVIAILSHELVICFSFGLRILKLFPQKKMIVIIICYAATIPLGVSIGIGIFESSSVGNHSTIDLVSGVFQGLSAGIFIYVSFFEILNEELTHGSEISKVFAVAVGFMFMASMVLIDMIGGDEVPGNHVNITLTNATQLQGLDLPVEI